MHESTVVRKDAVQDHQNHRCTAVLLRPAHSSSYQDVCYNTWHVQVHISDHGSVFCDNYNYDYGDDDYYYYDIEITTIMTLQHITVKMA